MVFISLQFARTGPAGCELFFLYGWYCREIPLPTRCGYPPPANRCASSGSAEKPWIVLSMLPCDRQIIPERESPGSISSVEKQSIFAELCYEKLIAIKIGNQENVYINQRFIGRSFFLWVTCLVASIGIGYKKWVSSDPRRKERQQGDPLSLKLQTVLWRNVHGRAFTPEQWKSCEIWNILRFPRVKGLGTA